MSESTGDKFGFGIALDLGIDQLSKATNFIKKSFSDIGNELDKNAKVVDKFNKSIIAPKELKSAASVITSSFRSIKTGISDSLKDVNMAAIIAAKNLDKINGVKSGKSAMPRDEAGRFISYTRFHENMKKQKPLLERTAYTLGRTFFKMKEPVDQTFNYITTKFHRLERMSEVMSRRGQKDFQKLGDSFSNVWKKIKDTKYAFAGFLVMVADVARTELEFTKLTTAANIGNVSVDAIMESSMRLSGELGVSIELTRDATEAMGKYGKAILNSNSIVSSFSTETIKNAIKANKAWGMELSESISLFDDLYKTMGLGPKAAKKYIEGLKGISKATGQTLTELSHLDKKIRNIDRAMQGFATPEQTQRATEYGALIEQFGGDAGSLVDVYKDLKSAVNIGNQATLFGQLGIDVVSASRMRLPELGMQLGKILKLRRQGLSRDQIANQSALIEKEGLAIDQQEALIRAYEQGGKAKKQNANLDKDYIKVMGTLAESVMRIANTFREAYTRVIKELFPIIKPAIVIVRDLVVKFNEWFVNLSPFTKRLMGLAFTGFLLSSVFLSMFQAGSLFFRLLFKGNIIVKALSWSLKMWLYPAARSTSFAFFLLRRAALAAWAGVTGPVGIVVGVLLAVGFAVYEIYKHWDKVKIILKEVGGLWIKLFSAAKFAWNSIKTSAKGAWDYMRDVSKAGMDWLTSGITSAFSSMGSAIADVILSPLETISNSWDKVKAKFSSLTKNSFSDLTSQLKTLGEFFMDAVLAPFREAGRIVGKLKDIMISITTLDFEGAKKSFKEIFSQGMTGQLIDGIQTKVRAGIALTLKEAQQVKQLGIDIGDKAIKIYTETGNSVAKGVANGIDASYKAIKQVFSSTASKKSNTPSAVKPSVSVVGGSNSDTESASTQVVSGSGFTLDRSNMQGLLSGKSSYFIKPPEDKRTRELEEENKKLREENLSLAAKSNEYLSKISGATTDLVNVLKPKSPFSKSSTQSASMNNQRAYGVFTAPNLAEAMGIGR